MSNKIDQDRCTKELFDILDEAFENHHGIFLDKGTSLIDTLETITAVEASTPVGGKCATLAAQVVHVNFYLEVLESQRSAERNFLFWGIGTSQRAAKLKDELKWG